MKKYEYLDTQFGGGGVRREGVLDRVKVARVGQIMHVILFIASFGWPVRKSGLASPDAHPYGLCLFYYS